MKPKIAILGAGPIGLEAAAAASRRGAEATVFEKGEPGEGIRSWGHVRMFSPFGMNSSPLGRCILGDHGFTLPRARDRLRAHRYVDDYLLPLASLLDIRRDTPVKQVRREPQPGRPIAVETASGEVFLADHVFDCTGVSDGPIRIDSGGPIPGADLCAEWIEHGVPDVSGDGRERFVGRPVLVVGAGYSGATVVRDLCAVRLKHPSTRIIWIAKRGVTPPIPLIPGDPIEAREALARHVNDLVRKGEIDFRPAHRIVAMEPVSGSVRVILEDAGHRSALEVDRIVATLGFSPCESITGELRLGLCAQTGAARGVAEHLAGIPQDLHALPHRLPADAVAHPEPGYFRLGAKSFGTLPGFLIATGLHQIDSALDAVFGGPA
jgi:hypothetical protein